MQPGEAVHPVPADRKRLAVPIAVGLALFFGGGRVVDLPIALEPDGYLLATVTSLLIRYVGAITVAVYSARLVRRLVVHMNTRVEAVTERSPASRRRTVPALVLVVVGLTLMAASEAQLPFALYQLDAGDYSGSPFTGTLGMVARVIFRTSAYLGPLLTAVGAYLALRRLEDSATAQPPATSPDLVLDLDE